MGITWPSVKKTNSLEKVASARASKYDGGAPEPSRHVLSQLLRGVGTERDFQGRAIHELAVHLIISVLILRVSREQWSDKRELC